MGQRIPAGGEAAGLRLQRAGQPSGDTPRKPQASLGLYLIECLPGPEAHSPTLLAPPSFVRSAWMGTMWLFTNEGKVSTSERSSSSTTAKTKWVRSARKTCARRGRLHRHQVPVGSQSWPDAAPSQWYVKSVDLRSSKWRRCLHERGTGKIRKEGLRRARADDSQELSVGIRQRASCCEATLGSAGNGERRMNPFVLQL